MIPIRDKLFRIFDKMVAACAAAVGLTFSTPVLAENIAFDYHQKKLGVLSIEERVESVRSQLSQRQLDGVSESSFEKSDNLSNQVLEPKSSRTAISQWRNYWNDWNDWVNWRDWRDWNDWSDWSNWRF
ncbi:hypothetical protein D0962_04080 [Leptolyngbyaceae cyanobacterium CCMR0082]|uniref:Uncharacterized protein n=1 Tax=Adonisia turfae CCMR0082 TaxID=2304604 RepID=A0A6M0S151_9CYAN|nr:hypothetical protein [Adonisia turfae]NEZ61960.1 hypothetical protein [Adonisia turfae CCMR0082]